MGDVNGRNSVDLGAGDLEEIYFPDDDGDSAVTEVSPHKTASDLQEHPYGDSGDSGDTSASRRTSWTAAELLATDFPEPRWAVPGLIAEGVTVIAGAPKVGKSWLSLGLGIATATGGKALGKLDVEPGPSLYLALEDTPRRLKTRLARMTPDLPSGLDKLTIATECPPLPAGGDAKIAGWLDRHHDARLVVIDVFSKVRGMASRDLSAYDADYAAMSRAKAVADHYGVPFVIVHHTRKMEAKDFLDEVSGTQGLAGAADAVMVLKRLRGKADGILHLTGRDVDEAEFALSFAAEYGTWQLFDVPAAEVAMGETRLAVLQYVRDHEGARPKEISEAIGLDYGLTKQTCSRMVKDGQIDTDGKGRYFVPLSAVTPVTAVTEPASSQVIALFDGDSHGDSDESPVTETDPHRVVTQTGAALNAATEDMLAASKAHQDALAQSIASKPIREYLIHRFGSYLTPSWTVAKIAPYHDPAEVRAALDQLVAEGVCRIEDGRYVSLIDEARERELLAASKSPRRVQITKAEVGYQIPPGAIYVGRPNSRIRQPADYTAKHVMTEFGNPHPVGKACKHCDSAEHTQADAVDLYRRHLADDPQLTEFARTLLAGKDLACWCKPTDPCHADVLLEIANATEPTEKVQTVGGFKTDKLVHSTFGSGSDEPKPKIPRSQKWRVDGFRVVATVYKSHAYERCIVCGNSGAVHAISAKREDGMSGLGAFCDAHRPAKGTLPLLEYQRVSHSDDANGLTGGSVVTFDRLAPNPAWSCTDCGQPAISRIEQRCTDCDDPAHWTEQTIPVMHSDGTEEQRTTRNHNTHVIAESFRCTDHIHGEDNQP